MKIGYIRVSSKDQNEDRQIKALEDIVDKMYIDKSSGKDTNIPCLQKMLSFIREGDILYIESISRLARNTRDFLELMDTFTSKGVSVICLKEPIDTTTPAGRMMATVFASMYQMERENIKQRQREGIEVAKQRGVKFGRPKIKAPNGFENIVIKWKNNEISAVRAMQLLGLKCNTFYRLVREYETNQRA